MWKYYIVLFTERHYGYFDNEVICSDSYYISRCLD